MHFYSIISPSLPEIFANNINKSPDMIEHLEIFIKNQESRTETIDGMMMIEDGRSVAGENVPEFVDNMDGMREAQEEEVQLIQDTMARESITKVEQPQPTYQETPEVPPVIERREHNLPRIVFVNEAGEEEAEEQIIIPGKQFAEISSLPSCSPVPPPPPPQQASSSSSCEPLLLPSTNEYAPQSSDKQSNPVETPKSTKKATGKNKRYPCQLCERIFESSTALKYHTTSHESRKIQCEYCDKLFLTKATLQIHLRIHLEKRPYDCSQCELRFRQKTDLNYHISSKHTAIEDYRFKCEYCGKKFARKYSLNLHTKLHTGEKNHTCEVCSKSFRASSYLQVHLRTHTGEKPYECATCGKRFTVKADVRRHIAQVHQEKKSRGGGGEGSSGTQKKKKAN